MKYVKHLIENWKVAFHALRDFFAHLIHGLIPAIKVKHHQPSDRPLPDTDKPNIKMYGTKPDTLAKVASEIQPPTGGSNVKRPEAPCLRITHD